MKVYKKLKSKFFPNKSKLYDALEHTWDGFGEEEPYYSVVTDDRYKMEKISDETLNDFYFSSGAKENTAYVNEKLQMLAGKSLEDFKNLRGLDFGCGVGRNSIHLAPFFKEFVGLDISEKHLQKARDFCKSQKVDNVKFLKSSQDIMQFGNFDFIFSVITLQHIPPPIMKDYIRQLLAMLNKGGYAFLHFPVAAYGGYKFFEDKYFKKEGKPLAWNMHVLSKKEAKKIIKSQQCELIQMDISFDLCGGKWTSGYFMIKRP